MNRDQYLRLRAQLSDRHEQIRDLEKEYMRRLLELTLSCADRIRHDFETATALLPFWINYSPKQRGRQPTGLSVPWAEVGEKALAFNLVSQLPDVFPDVSFPGLPFGGDIRFATRSAVVHLDVKLTGPNDFAGEIVVPTQQVSGDGHDWSNGVVNNSCPVTGVRSTMMFCPRLPPFYVVAGKIRVCLTYFLKAVYLVEDMGHQPLDYLELICLPNGLLLFDGPRYAAVPQLLIPGKDDKKKPAEDKRTRVRLEPLSRIEDGWRCVVLRPRDGKWATMPHGG